MGAFLDVVEWPWHWVWLRGRLILVFSGIQVRDFAFPCPALSNDVNLWSRLTFSPAFLAGNGAAWYNSLAFVHNINLGEVL